MSLNRFREGKYGTKFIAENFPDGFSGVKLTQPEQQRLLAVAASVHQTRSWWRKEQDPELIAIMGGPKGTAYSVKITPEEGKGAAVDISPLKEGSEATAGRGSLNIRKFNWQSEHNLGRVVFASAGGEEEEMVIQYEGRTACGEGYNIRLNGSQQTVRKIIA